MSHAINLIVNADDAGIAPAVNAAIFEGARKRVISATSVMPNMPYAEDAAWLFTQEVPHLELGLHFCLTSGHPITDPKEIPLLVDSNGNFNRGFIGLLRLFYSRSKNDFLAQVHKELLAQLDWFEKKRVSIVFVDGHQHIQMIPGIFELVQEEAKKRGLHIRISDEKIGSFNRLRRRFSAWFPSGLVKKWLLSSLSHRDAVAMSLLHLLVNKKPIISYHGVLDTGNFRLPAWEQLLDSVSAGISSPIGSETTSPVSSETTSPVSGEISASKATQPIRTILVNIHPATEDITSTQNGKLSTSDADKVFLSHPNRIGEWKDIIGDEFQKLLEKHNVKIVGFSSV